MNRQEIFDKVSKHLLTQMRSSQAPHGGQCQYRGPDGLMCAIGCLLPDDCVKEGKSITGLLEKFPQLNDLLGIEDSSDVGFLVSLQLIHDGYTSTRWKNQLVGLANMEGLNHDQL